MKRKKPIRTKAKKSKLKAARPQPFPVCGWISELTGISHIHASW